MDYYEPSHDTTGRWSRGLGWLLTVLSYSCGGAAIFWGPIPMLILGLLIGTLGRRLVGRPTYYGWLVGLGCVLGAGWVGWTQWIS